MCRRRLLDARSGARRVLTLCLVLATLCVVGCADEPWRGAPAESVSARFEGLSDVVVVNVVDRLPLRSAALVAPDGERVPAYSLDVSSSPVVAPSQENIIFMASPGVPRQVTRNNVMSSTALIQLPDPTRYAIGWHDWHVELRIGDAGDAGRDVVLDAPKPPR
jgi:hypothetical protein